MNDPRQQAFLKLKPPCVHLSSVALQFRTNEAPAKDVLQALEAVKAVLTTLGKDGQLDPKLAEYAFFPLAQQVFNEARRLSSRCLEVAADCVTLLVRYGYGKALLPALGKQLLILMSMLAGAGPSSQREPPTDELKVSAFDCISAVLDALTASKNTVAVLEDQGTQNVVDQLVYLISDSITDSTSDRVQILASQILLQIIQAIRSRVFLASLLPRTASSLTKALRPNTKIRRTQKTLSANLRALQCILSRTLADQVAVETDAQAEQGALDKSWRRATAGQVKNVLVQVCKLRTHESGTVQHALEELCVTIIEECQRTLADSIPIVLETLIILSAQPNAVTAKAKCRYLLTAYPNLAEMLKGSFATWTRSLPRQLQAQDERQKQQALQKLTVTLPLLSDSQEGMRTVVEDLVPVLAGSIGNMISDSPRKAVEVTTYGADAHALSALTTTALVRQQDFIKFLLNQESQRDTMVELNRLIDVLRESSERFHIVRNLTDSVAESEGASQLASLWLALQLLVEESAIGTSGVDDLLVDDVGSDKQMSRNSSLADLYSATFPLLSSVFEEQPGGEYGWQLQALAMETVVMYAQTFPGETYRPELMDTLYPVLSFLASSNTVLRNHAMTALNNLASSCKYTSTKALLISNVDYLVNSIAWKLNTYSLAPEAPQILRMMVYLCGAELIPYLDDLIQSIFAALDNYHGYTEWVELLFQALTSIVDVSIKQPQLAITQGKIAPKHQNSAVRISSESDILDDLAARKRRKIDFDRAADEPPSKAPHRPWTDALDGPTFARPAEASEEEPGNTDNEENEDDGHLAPMKPSGEEKEQKLSRSHTLLLHIAKSTVPHLASPSPRVRKLLLSLLKDISPLLARDEDSYMPLIHAIWPVIVPRLFAEQDSDEETAYNIAAAADTIAMLCENAGDFMASRIEDIFQQLTRLFRRIRSQVDLRGGVSTNAAKSDAAVIDKRPENSGQAITGSVDLQITTKPSTATNSGKVARPSSGMTFSTAGSVRTSKGQILASLIDLLLSILSHVRLTLDTGDAIMNMLLPLMHRREGAREVLETYNADAVWLYDYQTSIEPASLRGMAPGALCAAEGTPVLRNELRDVGLELSQYVIIA